MLRNLRLNYSHRPRVDPVKRLACRSLALRKQRLPPQHPSLLNRVLPPTLKTPVLQVRYYARQPIKWLSKKDERKEARLIKKANAPVKVPDNMNSKDLAQLVGVRTVDILKLLIRNNCCPRHSEEILPKDVVDNVLLYYGRIPDRSKSEEVQIKPRKIPDDPNLPSRNPIVVVLGHVDHGKTTLLDALRKSNIAEKEFGGITQSIAAFPVKTKHGEFVVIDTPGHAAFEAMRLRGAKSADIAILVVAVDDGVQEQTLQALEYIKQAEIPFVVAITKMDKKGHEVQKVKLQLNGYGVELEDFQGHVPVVPISALTGYNLDQLIEVVLALSSEIDLRTEETGPAEAIILDGKRDDWRGMVTSAILKVGTLKKGDAFVAGLAYGQVKMITDASGKILKEAKPGMPVEISGWEELPKPGDYLIVVEDLQNAKKVSEARKSAVDRKEVEEHLANVTRARLDEIEQERADRLKAIELGIDPDLYVKQQQLARMASGPRELSIIIKSDNIGSGEALRDAIKDFPTDEVKLNVIRTELGGITEQDIKEVNFFNPPPIFIGFNVSVPQRVKDLAEQHNMHVNSFKIIYSAIDWLKAVVSKHLEPTVRTHITAQAEVLQLFTIREGKKYRLVAGCRVTNGTLKRGMLTQVVRNGKVIYEGPMKSLRHVKEDVRQVESGKECGLSFDEEVDVQVGDIIQNVEREEIERKIKLVSESTQKRPTQKYSVFATHTKQSEM